MPVRFNSERAPEAFQVLQFALDAPLWLRLGADPSFRRSTPLHWLPDHKRAVPCMHEDCPWCPSPKRYATFVPVLAYSPIGRCWKQKVLQLTQRMDELLKENHGQSVWEFVRRGRHNAPVTWKRCETLTAHDVFAGFNVEPSLLKMWGMWSQLKKTSARPDAEALRLFVDSGGVDAEAS